MANDYFLENYDLTKGQVAQSFFVSEYALRHFSEAKASNDWKGRVVHALIGTVELIPILGPIGSILERACFSFVQSKRANLAEKNITTINEKTSSQPTKKVSLISKILGLDKGEKPKPFTTYWPRNEVAPEFSRYAQGVFSIKTDELIPPDLKGEVSELEIRFVHQGKEFYKESASATQPSIDTFLMNLPFDEEVSVQITANKKDGSTQQLESLSFQANQLYGTYRASKMETDWEIESSQLNKPAQWHEGKEVPNEDLLKGIYRMGAPEFKRPIDIEIGQGKLKIDTHFKLVYKPNFKFAQRVYDEIERSKDEHYVFVNNDSQTQVLNLVFNMGTRLLSLSVVVPPNEKKTLSQKILLDQLKDAYQKSTKEPLPEKPIIELFYIQHLQY